ncbi:hypothetical protein SLH49_05935 [Cognatiyoonia sp. IB215446]|uniref:hypothetical protein n=1 Tax=Cognatiyoonia sp. IB215446 TaxID=3097355 RepID=UPI002A104D37|nr:hypothetical protein [Cognatiyoonia sp. IB215446]MDX8347522.1 hypothetical protein [Cognatiyoonia sp. IB215446]
MRRFRDLETGLPAAYQRAITAPPDDTDAPHLIALAIDLTRKKRSTLPYEDLTEREKRLALHALAVEQLPGWVVAQSARRLPGTDRKLVHQLRHIKTSRPAKKAQHFGAVQRVQRIRASSKS